MSVYQITLPVTGIPTYTTTSAFPTTSYNGAQAIDLSTDTLYIYSTSSSTWVAVATPGAAIALDGLTGDVTASGPGVAAATVAHVGGSSAAAVNTATVLVTASQSANLFLASPNGSAAAPSFRAIVAADVPTLNQNTSGTAANVTATSNASLTTLSVLSLPATQVSGTLPQANGGTGLTATFGPVISSVVTSGSNVITSTSFVNFSNSPALGFTPTLTGTYKIYASVPCFVDGNSRATVRIGNTSGGATLLAESQATAFASGTNNSQTLTVQSVYTLTASTAYVFDIQGKDSAAVGFNNIGGTAQFYMFAEKCL